MRVRTTQSALSSQGHVAVVDGCMYGRDGLVAALQGLSGCSLASCHVSGFASLDEVQQAWLEGVRGMKSAETTAPLTQPTCLAIRLPAMPQAVLDMLLHLGELTRGFPPAVRLVVLSVYPPEKVLRVLAGLGISQHVHVIDARLPVLTLCRMLMLAVRLNVFSLSSWLAESPVRSHHARLTLPERWVLRQSVREVPVHKQANRRSVDAKTLYSQRSTAFHKLGVPHLHGLLGWFRLPERHGTVGWE